MKESIYLMTYHWQTSKRSRYFTSLKENFVFTSNHFFIISILQCILNFSMILSTVSLALFSKFGHNLKNQLLHPPAMAYSLKTVRNFSICFSILPFLSPYYWRQLHLCLKMGPAQFPELFVVKIYSNLVKQSCLNFLFTTAT